MHMTLETSCTMFSSGCMTGLVAAVLARPWHRMPTIAIDKMRMVGCPSVDQSFRLLPSPKVGSWLRQLPTFGNALASLEPRARRARWLQWKAPRACVQLCILLVRRTKGANLAC
uniref:Putative secreted protein n=1 Tax=Ixodes ricinus TaxID=34613 RepID=A0A147BDP4_IXORI